MNLKELMERLGDNITFIPNGDFVIGKAFVVTVPYSVVDIADHRPDVLKAIKKLQEEMTQWVTEIEELITKE